jgi:hypothetical protein
MTTIFSHVSFCQRKKYLNNQKKNITDSKSSCPLPFVSDENDSDLEDIIGD